MFGQSSCVVCVCTHFSGSDAAYNSVFTVAYEFIYSSIGWQMMRTMNLLRPSALRPNTHPLSYSYLVLHYDVRSSFTHRLLKPFATCHTDAHVLCGEAWQKKMRSLRCWFGPGMWRWRGAEGGKTCDERRPTHRTPTSRHLRQKFCVFTVMDIDILGAARKVFGCVLRCTSAAHTLKVELWLLRMDAFVLACVCAAALQANPNARAKVAPV